MSGVFFVMNDGKEILYAMVSMNWIMKDTIDWKNLMLRKR